MLQPHHPQSQYRVTGFSGVCIWLGRFENCAVRIVVTAVLDNIMAMQAEIARTAQTKVLNGVGSVRRMLRPT